MVCLVHDDEVPSRSVQLLEERTILAGRSPEKVMIHDVEAGFGLHGAVNDGAARAALAEVVGDITPIDHTGIVEERTRLAPLGLPQVLRKSGFSVRARRADLFAPLLHQ